MSRLDIMTPSHAQTVIDGLYRDVERRIAASPPGLCPVDLAKSFLDLCHAQTCGKCVPCRIGLGQLSELMEQVLEGEATMETISIIERVARVIVNSADCAIGRDAARLVLDGVQGFRDDYEEHILRHRCLGGMREPVPCVALCPAGVDIPGYLVLIKYGRYADAVRLIRKDNPFPSACAYICEHPCEARCRRNMIDDAVNIRGLKRYAVDNAGYVPQPDCAEPTGKKVAVIGGGPSGLSAAYYLALMGHKVTVYEKRAKLGGMLRYGIPNYRLPREVLDAEIASMLALGIDVHVNVNVGDDVTFDELRQQNDALYIALGAHTDKKTGIEGEDAEGVISAVEMLREIGDDYMPDFRNKDIVVIGGGNVAMDVCRSAVRLGARKVSCVYRRRQEDMTALPEEVEGAVAEGVELVTLQAPVRIETDANGHAVALWTQPQIIGEMDKKGRPAPEKAKRSEKRIAADVVVVAIGQGVETHGFEQTKIAIKRGAFVAEASGQIDNMDGVFAGGMGIDIAFQGVIITILVIASFFAGMYFHNGVIELSMLTDGIADPEGVTMAFITLSMVEIFHSFNMRSRRASIFSMKTQNKWLWGASALAVVLTIVPVEVDFLAEVFGFMTLDPIALFTALGLAFLIIPLMEIYKAVMRRVEKNQD